MLRPPAAPDHRGPTGTPTAEWRRIVEAVAAVRREIERIRAVAAREVGPQEAQIFDAHLMLLGDAEVLADLGISSHRLLTLCGLEGMLPADVTAEICQQLGCGDELEELRDS